MFWKKIKSFNTDYRQPKRHENASRRFEEYRTTANPIECPLFLGSFEGVWHNREGAYLSLEGGLFQIVYQLG